MIITPNGTNEGTPLTIGVERLPLAQEQALNVMLARALSFRGVPLYRISWAAEDWNPAAPLCLENQSSYHLLTRELPSPQLAHFEKQLGEDTSQGVWACQFHFIDPVTDQPFDPTASVVERIIPMLRAAREMNLMAQIGATAALQRMWRQRRDAAEAREVKRRQDCVAKAKDLIDSETKPAFDGMAWSGGHGGKTRHTSEIILTDLR